MVFAVDSTISQKNKILIAIIAFLLSSALAIIGTFARAVPQWLDGASFLYGLNNAFDGERYGFLIKLLLVLSNYSPGLIALIALSLVIRFEVGTKDLIYQTFKWALLSIGVGSLFVVVLYLFDVGPYPGWLLSNPFTWTKELLAVSIRGILLILPYWLVNVFIMWVCLLGFFLGLRVSFLSKFMSENDKNTPIQINLKKWGIYLLILSILLYALSQYKFFLAIRCAAAGNSSAVIINDNAYFSKGAAGKYLPLGTCVTVNANSELSDFGFVFVNINGEVGTVYEYDVYWFGEKSSIPVITQTPFPTTTPAPTWTPGATSTELPSQTPTP